MLYKKIRLYLILLDKYSEFIFYFIGTLAKNEGELPKFNMLKKNVLENRSEDLGGSCLLKKEGIY